MRLLKINDYIIDLDDNTAIGIDVQNFDLTSPSKRFVNASNSFSIPKTINNLKAIGFIGGIPNVNPNIYDNFSVQYFLNNEIVIDGSYVVIKEISERISLEVLQKPTLWDEMKSLSWDYFQSEYFDFLVSEKALPITSNRGSGTFLQALNSYLDSPDGSLRLYPSYTNEMDTLGVDYLNPRTKNFQIFYGSNTPYIRGNGGHMWSDVKTLFEFIEYKYDVDFDILGTHDDNPFLNSNFLKTIWLIREIAFIQVGNEYWFSLYVSSFADSLMQNDVFENNGLDLYGLMFSILNIWGIVIEDVGNGKYRLRDINYDIDNKNPVNVNINLEGEDKKAPKLTPSIKGFAQESIIKYTNYSDGINSTGTRKIVECNNSNIQFRKDIIKIENFIPAVKDSLLNYGVDNSFEQYKISTWEEINDSYTWHSYFTVGVSETIAKTDYKKVIPIDLSDKWQILDRALDNPLYIEQRAWITPTQFSQVNNWTLYYIPELAGSYYINKIKGYNPDKSLQSVTLELIRINNNTPK